MSSIFSDFKEAFAKRNNGLIQLIWLNVAVYMVILVILFACSLTKQMNWFEVITGYVSLSPSLIQLLYRPWTLFTYSFVHAVNPIAHLLPNMLLFYWFGGLIEEYLGSNRLISLYVLGAVGGAILTLLLLNFLPFFHNYPSTNYIIGASSSVMAVVAAAATLLPDYVFVLILLGPVRIKYIAFFLFVVSFSSALVTHNMGSGILHLGGGILGYLYIKQLQAGRDLGLFVQRILTLFQDFPNKKPQVTVTTFAKERKNPLTGPGSSSLYPNEAEIDEILDKISRSGYESLTKEEKQKLFRASQQ